MVCMGNVCRSPMARAVTQTTAQRAAPGDGAGTDPRQAAFFDAAGTHADPAGERLDSRARAALLRRGYGVDDLRSRRVTTRDFDRFDLVVAMDAANLTDLRTLCPPEHTHKLRLFLDFAPGFEGQDVPDPYFGDASGFERVLDLCEAGARGLIDAAQQVRMHAGRSTVSRNDG